MLNKFLMIAAFCDLMLGFSISSIQKKELIEAIKQFNPLSNTLAIVSSSEDALMAKAADSTVALQTRYCLSDSLIQSDIMMNNFYGMTYLLFRHGTFLHRRLAEATRLLIYRSFLLLFATLPFMCQNGFVSVIPFKALGLTSFVALLSPIQIIAHASTYLDIGYHCYHRVFGEYKRNLIIPFFSSSIVIKELLSALLHVGP